MKIANKVKSQRIANMASRLLQIRHEVFDLRSARIDEDDELREAQRLLGDVEKALAAALRKI